jgi:hypothetical protein
MTLTAVTVSYGPYTAVSIEQISNNLSFLNVVEDTYTITTNQARYLNVTAGLNKTINVATDQTITALELKGGNAYWRYNNDGTWVYDNVINLSDASVVGAKYGTGTIVDDADVNFDNNVDIFDLALVGGNYGLESAMAYSSWIVSP